MNGETKIVRKKINCEIKVVIFVRFNKMNVKFHKYQGAGNDFLLLNNRYKTYSNLTTEQISRLCDRHFGVGADGLMLLENSQGHDFKMVYFNSDGRQSTMCGNGGRCIIRFAHDQKIIGEKTLFIAVDGQHWGKINEDGSVSLQMIDVNDIEYNTDDFILQTGSPHYVIFTENVKEVDVFNEARKVRYNKRFKDFGINVNFVQPISENEIFVRTYERGVEDETLSCGTGVVAASLAYVLKNDLKSGEIGVETKGGNLSVSYTRNGDSFTDVWLTGGAVKVFEGSVEI